MKSSVCTRFLWLRWIHAEDSCLSPKDMKTLVELVHVYNGHLVMYRQKIIMWHHLYHSVPKLLSEPVRSKLHLQHHSSVCQSTLSHTITLCRQGQGQQRARTCPINNPSHKKIRCWVRSPYMCYYDILIMKSSDFVTVRTVTHVVTPSSKEEGLLDQPLREMSLLQCCFSTYSNISMKVPHVLCMVLAYSCQSTVF